MSGVMPQWILKKLDTKTTMFKLYVDMRKKCSSSFKAQVLLEILKEEKTISKLAAEHGVYTMKGGANSLNIIKSLS